MDPPGSALIHRHLAISVNFSRAPWNEEDSKLNYPDFLERISFRLVGPRTTVGEKGWFLLDRTDGSYARLLSLPRVPLDLINTSLPYDERRMKNRLRHLTQIPRMSTFAMSALIQRAVWQMRMDAAFVNIGLWHGFTFLSGLIGNSPKRCIGVDNFSQFSGPRDAFAERFERIKGSNHRFYDLDYSEYFSTVHQGAIGFYIYDGGHSYENQLLGLQIAEPFFTDDCVILVDDTNWPEPRQAIRDFIAGSKHGYRILLDETTLPYSGRLTYWNGATVFQRTGEPVEPKSRDTAGMLPESPKNWGHSRKDEHEDDIGEPHVSLVITNWNCGDAMRALIDVGLSQTYPNVEVVVVDEGSTDQSHEVIQTYGNRIVPFVQHQKTQAETLRFALDQTRGQYVAFMEADDFLNETSVAEALESGKRQAQWALRECETAGELAEIVPAGEMFILVDEEQLNRQVAAGRRALPFLERSGVYWGRPPDDATAIRELERLRECGAGFIVFCWPTFWWLDYYRAFAAHLSSNYQCLRRNDRLVVYALGKRRP